MNLQAKETIVEAQKLPPLPDGEPAVGLEGDLPPLLKVVVDDTAALPPTKKLISRTVENKTAVDEGAHGLLIFFVIGLLSFIAGIALASTVLVGILDLNTGWLKDLLDTLKDLARHKSG